MKKISLTVLMSLILAFTTAQERDQEAKITYSNITEFGFFMASPRGVAFEATTMNGFAINKQHCLGFGIGIGFQSYEEYESVAVYTPIFVNYRLYFKPGERFSPHINASLGSFLLDDGEGLYSSFSAGFRAGKFSFSSGISFMPVQRSEKIWDSQIPYDASQEESKWYYPFGVLLKWGFSF
ncbi:MAG: hypothetical protein LBH92_06565 [Bacteroidales bacterium]|jgi:hypothetical protein|nr:hypothetical protein [Bacteroidales bacterium]